MLELTSSHLSFSVIAFQFAARPHPPRYGVRAASQSSSHVSGTTSSDVWRIAGCGFLRVRSFARVIVGLPDIRSPAGNPTIAWPFDFPSVRGRAAASSPQPNLLRTLYRRARRYVFEAHLMYVKTRKHVGLRLFETNRIEDRKSACQSNA